MKNLRKMTTILLALAIILFSFFIFPNAFNKNTYNDSDTSYTDSMENIETQYQKVNEKVIPYIVEANVVVSGTSRVGEIIEDKNNGEAYLIKCGDESKWFSSNLVDLIEKEQLLLDDLSNYEIELYVNYNSFESETNYFVWVDLARLNTYVLKKENGYFFMYKTFQCSAGANITPTKRGLYKISNKGDHFYTRDMNSICYNFLQYSGSYLFHSNPYDLKGLLLDDRIKHRVSNGCVRFSLNDSKIFYDLIEINTTIWVN